MAKIKVAIDGGPLSGGHSVRGIGVMVRGQIEAVRKYQKSRIDLDVFDFDSPEGQKKLEVGNYDIVHYPYFFPYSQTLPSVKKGRKLVVTIQDLIHMIYPDKYPPGFKGKYNLFRQKKLLSKIDAVLTITETSKKDIVRLLGIPSSKIKVVYIATQPDVRKINDQKVLENIRRKYKLPQKFALYVGDVNYNKNIPGLIRACEIAKIPLVLVGKHALEIEELGVNLKHLKGPRDWLRFLFNIPHPELFHFKGLVDVFKNNTNIMRLGFVEGKDLSAIFNLASVYVQPSFYEGFGIPVLEAMACGTPVVVSKTNALVEVAGNAALIADPAKPEDIARNIKKAVNDIKTKTYLMQKGTERAKQFSWQKTAKETVDFYQSVAGS